MLQSFLTFLGLTIIAIYIGLYPIVEIMFIIINRNEIIRKTLESYESLLTELSESFMLRILQGR